MSIEPKPGESSPAQAAMRDTTTLTESPSATPSPEDGPPPLGYSLYAKHRRRNICIFWSLVVFDSVAMPIFLYFVLWYETSLSPNATFSIVTAAVGGVSIVDYTWRFWKLVKKNSDCRVPGKGRWHLDFFHWVFSWMWTIVIVELIVGTCPRNPPIRLLAMPNPSALYTFALMLAALDIMRWCNIPSPCQISSQPKGCVPKPAIYFIIEDVIAVDGCGTSAFRQALAVRYEASHVFRTMLKRLSVFWWTGGLAAATLTTILIFTLPHDPAYVVGWSLPFVWAGIWALATTLYVRRQLKVEARTWSKVEVGGSGLDA